MALLASVLAFGQNITVTGTVNDSSTGEPVPFASIQVKGTMTGAASDGLGRYSIQAPSNATLVFSSIGYVNMELPVNGRTVLNVALVPDSEYLDETIVVAYGTSTKATFTGSTSVMKSETLEKRQVSNLSNALSGAVAGVQTMNANGQPGTSSTIRIRGFGSINAGMNPLYVLDGVPYDGDISAINTQDIESMSVLKDAAAAALYGARGANGVIMITTKKGKAGDATINFDARVGVNSRAVKNYNVMNSTAMYTEKVYEAYYLSGLLNQKMSSSAANLYANQNIFKGLGYQYYTLPKGQYLIGTNGKLNPNAALGYSDGNYFYTPDDWAKETFSSQARQEYNLSISGGNDRISYYISGGYLTDNGVIKNSGFERFTTRTSVDYQAKDWLKVGANLAYTNSTSRYPGEQTSTSSSGNSFFIANFIAPVYPMYVRNADGSMQYNDGTPVYDYGDGTSTPRKRNWMSISNPMGDIFYQTEVYLMDIMNNKWYATITPFDGFSLTASLGLNIDNTRYHLASSSLYGQSAAYHGEAEQEHDRSLGMTHQYIANYKKTFGLHNLDLTAVYEAYKYQSESSWAYGQNLYREGIPYVNNTIDEKRGGGSASEYSTLGYIGRINYDYAEKYFASLSYRRDATSRFAPENRCGNFWSVSAAWNLVKEPFMANAGWIDLLKLKASFGQQGNDSVGNSYAYLDQYSVTGSDGLFADATLAYKGNRDLTWETTNAFNAGVDFDMWGGRLAGSIEYFDRTATNMLYYKPTAPSLGYSSIPMNIGSMANRGVELDLTATLINTANVRWDINANATYLDNKILKLADDLNGELIDGSTIYQEGKSRYQMYLTQYAGPSPVDGIALYKAKGQDPAKNDGVKSKDYKGDEVEKDAEYLTSDWSAAYNTNRKATGDLAAKVSGGFGTTLSFYGFDFSVQFSYQLGGRLYDSGYARLM
ncbi:MAG: SusC/RagA family TonB-linked outer membrane protein, partial [Bacteroidales bacterium]|nr:SusC/RagA family TonB-linked outer membrane protein [Bacteroidales bacterium]